MIENYDLTSALKVRDFKVGIIDHFFLHPKSTWEDFNVLTITLEKMNGFNKTSGNL
jgi:hypothetical protein